MLGLDISHGSHLSQINRWNTNFATLVIISGSGLVFDSAPQTSGLFVSIIRPPLRALRLSDRWIKRALEGSAAESPDGHFKLINLKYALRNYV